MQPHHLFSTTLWPWSYACLMGTIGPEEELDDDTWDLFLRACEEDEDSDMPPRKRTKTGESIEQSSVIDRSRSQGCNV